MARHTLLLIEGEESIAEPLQLALEREGFEHSGSGDSGLDGDDDSGHSASGSDD